jgi:hypothetical protein
MAMALQTVILEVQQFSKIQKMLIANFFNLSVAFKNTF